MAQIGSNYLALLGMLLMLLLWPLQAAAEGESWGPGRTQQAAGHSCELCALPEHRQPPVAATRQRRNGGTNSSHHPCAVHASTGRCHGG